MLPTASALEALEARFGFSSLNESGEVTVICLNCHHRGMSPDRSGHLGLNLEKNVAHCVRCGWSSRDLKDWLSKLGVDTAALMLGGGADSFLIFKEEREAPELITQALSLPYGTRPLTKDDWSNPNNPFTGSLIAKNLTWDIAQYWPIAACEDGFYKGYVIFPFIENDEIVYWQGRATSPDMRLRKSNPSKKQCVLGKKNWLYGYALCSAGCNLYLVEGTLDQISLQWHLWQTLGHGHVALAIQGTSLSFPAAGEHHLNSQFGQIAALRPASVTFMFDADAFEKAKGLASVCSRCGLPAKASRIIGKDPNDTDQEDLDNALRGDEWSWANLALQRVKY